MKIAGFLFLSFCLAAFPAFADVVVGQECDQLGASRMTTDRQNIAVCLENTAGKLIWKASTESSGGEYCGLAFKAPATGPGNSCSDSGGRAIYNNVIPVNVLPCNGENIFRNFVAQTLYANTFFPYNYETACPSGYVLQTGTDIPTGASEYGCPSTVGYLKPFYCKKN